MRPGARTRRGVRAVAGLAVALGLCVAGDSVAGDRAAVAAPGAAPRLLVNGGEPISKSHQENLFAYAECAAGVPTTGPSGAELGMPGGWYQVGGRGFWARIAVVNAARPGPHETSVGCSDGSTLRATFVLTR